MVYRGYGDDGYATPMRGKSMTCREAWFLLRWSLTMYRGHRPPIF
jgi:hypothetical protein